MGGKAVKVTERVYRELMRLKKEWGLKSVNKVIERLLEGGNQVTPGNPLDSLKCRAICMGRIYRIECSDGRRAVVPPKTLEELAARFGDSFLIEKECEGDSK